MQTYLVVKDFRYRRNKRGEEYGMSVAVYSTPESIWGYEKVTSAYNEEPEESKNRIIARVKDLYPNVTDKDIKKLIL